MVGGVVWTQVPTPAARNEWAERASPALGVAAGPLGGGRRRDRRRGLGALQVGGADAPRRGAEAYFEPLSDRLDVDPEDHRSAPLFNGP